MISVLTLTYQRYHLLEEAIYSYFNQGWKGDSEMVIVNDSPSVKYEIDSSFADVKNVRVININERFTSLGKKLEWSYKQCKGDYIYLLEDDDLLTPWALALHEEYRKEQPDKEIYRCKYHYFFEDNKFKGLYGNVNTGNCYSKSYLDRIAIPDKVFGWDTDIVFRHNANIYEGDTGRYSMIYRWGMGVYHLSGMGDISNEDMFAWADKKSSEKGIIKLNPHFDSDYWEIISNLEKK